MNKVRRVKTLQIGSKLFILNGMSPLRYVDLTKNVVKQYPRKNTRVYKIVSNFIRGAKQ